MTADAADVCGTSGRVRMDETRDRRRRGTKARSDRRETKARTRQIKRDARADKRQEEEEEEER